MHKFMYIDCIFLKPPTTHIYIPSPVMQVLTPLLIQNIYKYILDQKQATTQRAYPLNRFSAGEGQAQQLS